MVRALSYQIYDFIFFETSELFSSECLLLLFCCYSRFYWYPSSLRELFQSCVPICESLRNGFMCGWYSNEIFCLCVPSFFSPSIFDKRNKRNFHFFFFILSIVRVCARCITAFSDRPFRYCIRYNSHIYGRHSSLSIEKNQMRKFMWFHETHGCTHRVYFTRPSIPIQYGFPYRTTTKVK